jgi:hypothetical protein
MADTSRRKNIARWAAKKLDKIRLDLRDESDDRTIHQWNVGQRLATAAEEDEDIRKLVLVDWAHKTTAVDDHKRRPDFSKDCAGLPFDYHAARNQWIPIRVSRGAETPERIRFGDASAAHLRVFLKIKDENKKAVLARFETDEEQIKMLLAMFTHRLKTVDDVMRAKYGWTPRPEPGPVE